MTIWNKEEDDRTADTQYQRSGESIRYASCSRGGSEGNVNEAKSSAGYMTLSPHLPRPLSIFNIKMLFLQVSTVTVNPMFQFPPD
jgi:hypothetical protein